MQLVQLLHYRNCGLACNGITPTHNPGFRGLSQAPVALPLCYRGFVVLGTLSPFWGRKNTLVLHLRSAASLTTRSGIMKPRNIAIALAFCVPLVSTFAQPLPQARGQRLEAVAK